MGWQIFLVVGAGALTAVVYAMSLTSTGSVLSFDDEGFFMLTIVRTKQRIRWDQIRGPIQRVRVLRSRLMIPRSRKSFLSFHHYYSIILRGGASEDSFVREVDKRFGIRDVRDISGLIRP